MNCEHKGNRFFIFRCHFCNELSCGKCNQNKYSICDNCYSNDNIKIELKNCKVCGNEDIKQTLKKYKYFDEEHNDITNEDVCLNCRKELLQAMEENWDGDKELLLSYPELWEQLDSPNIS